MRKVAFLLLFLFLSPSLGTVHAAELPLVTAIEIQGLMRIEEGAVISKISQKTGEPVSRDKTSQDIKTIFRMGYFEDVRVEMEVFEGGVKLIYVVKEKPTIIRVEFQGNREIEDSELKEKTTITPGSIADTVLIQDNALKIKAFYEEKGYWLANVTPVIKKLSDEEVSLTYQINEGPKIRIGNVIIEGNKK
ncbi:MAG: POTRA domain-containing protein, partial [Nitrospirota bacterium]|nr:POTRA domain-containing protein [Nitrospirota bacterium]